MSLIRFTKACGGRVFLNDPPCHSVQCCCLLRCGDVVVTAGAARWRMGLPRRAEGDRGSSEAIQKVG
jgi:hypothetical protein